MLVHVILSLIGILSGFVALFGMITGKRLDGWTAIFLVTTVLTSITGFLLPFHKLLPSHILGIISLVVLAVAITATIALYLNVFVLVAQLFLKVPVLHAMAPKGSEPPFLISQVVVMAVFVVLTIAAVIKFHPEAVHAS
jgi:hypothetical protein